MLTDINKPFNESAPQNEINKHKVLVIIPCYNEEDTIKELAEEVKQYTDVCVIDDGSSDNTPEKLISVSGIHVITHDTNKNITASILDGMRYAIANNYDFTVTMDAGYSHNPNVLPSFFDYTNYDCVIGSRKKKIAVPIYRKLISWFASRVINYSISNSFLDFKGPGIADCTSGYRMYSNKAIKNILSKKLRSTSFAFHMEVLAITYNDGYKIKEIPIKYNYTNSSLSLSALNQAIKFGIHLLIQKGIKQ